MAINPYRCTGNTSIRVDRKIKLATVVYAHGSKSPGNTHTTQRLRVDGCIAVEIDLQALVDYLGARALSTKSGKSKIQGGIITARVLTRKTVGVEPPRVITLNASSRYEDIVEVNQPEPVEGKC